MAVAQQVVRGQVAAKLVVVAHAVTAHAVDKTVNHHKRNGQLCEIVHQLLIGGELVRDHKEDAIHSAVHQQADQLGVALGGTNGVGDEQQVSPLAAENLEVVGKRGKVAALDVGHDQPKRARLLHHEAAGDLVGDVVLATRDLLDATSVLLAHATRSVVENERHRGGRKPHLARDVLERHLCHVIPPIEEPGQEGSPQARTRQTQQ